MSFFGPITDEQILKELREKAELDRVQGLGCLVFIAGITLIAAIKWLIDNLKTGMWPLLLVGFICCVVGSICRRS